MKGCDVVVYTDPKDIDDCMTVGQLRAELERFDDDHFIAVATGDARYAFIPVYSVAATNERLVLEL